MKQRCRLAELGLFGREPHGFSSPTSQHRHAVRVARRVRIPHVDSLDERLQKIGAHLLELERPEVGRSNEQERENNEKETANPIVQIKKRHYERDRTYQKIIAKVRP